MKDQNQGRPIRWLEGPLADPIPDVSNSQQGVLAMAPTTPYAIQQAAEMVVNDLLGRLADKPKNSISVRIVLPAVISWGCSHRSRRQWRRVAKMHWAPTKRMIQKLVVGRVNDVEQRSFLTPSG